MNEYLKRGEGRKSNITKYDFFSYYRKNAEFSKLERKQYSGFLKELLTTYSEAIVKEALELKLGSLGYIRIQAKKLTFLNAKGKPQKSLKVNWKDTWTYWENKYQEMTRDEIVKIENKKVIYHLNDHTNQEFYRHLWDKTTAIVKYKRFYNFKASRQYSRMIATIVKDPQRKIFYYG
jgi:hypothetical protein